MNNLTKNLKCILMRNGVEIWKESERMNNLAENLIRLTKSSFVKIDEEIINTADILGIFTPQTLEAYNRRKKGQWQCQWGGWHDKTDTCECGRPEIPKYEMRDYKISPEAMGKIDKIRNQLKDKLSV